MPELQEMLEGAEQAALADDFDAADELLRGVARIQETELGPLHPDLANTFNNLAIVAEKAGRLNDAEAFYRRAVAIAEASLPDGHPMIAASRENLEAFCVAQGKAPGDAERPWAEARFDPPLPEAPVERPWPEVRAATPDPVEESPPAIPAGAAADETRPAMPDRVEPEPPAGRGGPRAVAGLAIGAVAAVFALMIWQPWSSRDTPSPASASAAGPPAQATPSEQARPTTIAPAPASRDTAAIQQPAPSSSDVVTLAAAELCQSFSTGAGDWRCDAAGDQVSPGPIVLYTRVRSASDGAVVHRWYRGETLMQAVKLTTRANAKQGYRTYSRQTVGGGEWRVEVVGEGGAVLHEERFAVR